MNMKRVMRTSVGILLLIIGILPLTGCVSTGAVDLLDRYGSSAEAQQQQNQAVERCVEKVDVSALQGKRVLISGKQQNFPTSTDYLKGNPMFSSGLSNFRTIMERKISGVGGKCMYQEWNPTVQQTTPECDIVMDVTEDVFSLDKRVVYFPFWPMFFMLDIFQNRTYWAVSQYTLDFKTPDRSQILSTQKVQAQSDQINKLLFFRMTEMF